MEISVGKKTALIIGGSGLVGRNCLHMLIANNAYQKVVSLGRRKLDITSDKLVQHIVDFNDMESYRELTVCDDIYICLGTTIADAGSKEKFYKIDHQYVINTAFMAHDAGANQCLIITALNADINSSFFYNRVKGEIERDLKSIGFWSLHIFRPSLLLGDRKDDRLGEEIAKKLGKGFSSLLGNKLKKYRPIEASDVAKAMVKVGQNLVKGEHTYNSDVIYDIAHESNTKNIV